MTLIEPPEALRPAQAALHAAQHFHPLDVEQVQPREGAAGDVAATDVGAVPEQTDAGLRIGGPRSARPADRDVRGQGVRCVGEVHARRVAQQLLGVGQPALVANFLRPQGGGRHRHVAQPLLALAGGDQQLFDGHAFGRSALRERGRRHGAAQRRQRRTIGQDPLVHVLPPHTGSPPSERGLPLPLYSYYVDRIILCCNAERLGPGDRPLPMRDSDPTLSAAHADFQCLQGLEP